MAPPRYAAKFDPFLSWPWLAPHALHPGAIQGKEGIKFCHLATLDVDDGNASVSRLSSCNDIHCPRPSIHEENGRERVSQQNGRQMPDDGF